MFERFTDRARRVLVLAQEEVRMLNHNYLGTEHLLLALVAEREGVAAQALESLRISLEAVRQQVEAMIDQGDRPPVGHIPFTPRAKKVMEHALRESLHLGHHYIGTEHMLLGLLREGEGVAAQALTKLGVELHRVRLAVIEIVTGEVGNRLDEPPADVSREDVHDPETWPLCLRCRSPLAETALYRVIDVRPTGQGNPRAVSFAYCGNCGTWLGTVR